MTESDGDLLQRLGMDGHKWAAEFRAVALRLGYSDMDEGWLIGWFSNSIMAGYDEARRRFDAPDQLAALKMVREAVAMSDKWDLPSTVFLAVKDAIAKAEGRDV